MPRPPWFYPEGKDSLAGLQHVSGVFGYAARALGLVWAEWSVNGILVTMLLTDHKIEASKTLFDTAAEGSGKPPTIGEMTTSMTYERNGTFEKFEGYCTDVWFREGMRFVSENKDKPVFLYLALNAPHGPYYVPVEWAEPYQVDPESAPFAKFYGLCTNIDHNMGLLRAHLDEHGLTDITILMTDNGTAAG